MEQVSKLGPYTTTSLLSEVGHAEGGLAKAVDKGPQHLVSFLSDVEEG